MPFFNPQFDYGNLFMGYGDMMQQDAQTKEINARTNDIMQDTDRKKLENQQTRDQQSFQQKLGKLISQSATGMDLSKPENVTSLYNKEADFAAASGFANESNALREKALNIAEFGLNQQRARIQTDEEALKDQEAKWELDSRLFNSITDKTPEDLAQKIYAEARSKDPSLPPNYPGKAALKEFITRGESVHTWNQDRLKDLQEEDRKVRLQSDKLRAETARIQAQTAAAREAREADTRRQKELQASSRTPNKDEREATERVLRQRFPGLNEDAPKDAKGNVTGLSDSLVSAANSIASEARKRLMDNPSIGSFDDAMHMVIRDRERTGDFKHLGKKDVMISGGKTPGDAMSLPETKEELIDGRYYEHPATGQIVRYDATDGTFKAVFIDAEGAETEEDITQEPPIEEPEEGR